jgi:hypothetical protein
MPSLVICPRGATTDPVGCQADGKDSPENQRESIQMANVIQLQSLYQSKFRARRDTDGRLSAVQPSGEKRCPVGGRETHRAEMTS